MGANNGNLLTAVAAAAAVMMVILTLTIHASVAICLDATLSDH